MRAVRLAGVSSSCTRAYYLLHSCCVLGAVLRIKSRIFGLLTCFENGTGSSIISMAVLGALCDDGRRVPAVTVFGWDDVLCPTTHAKLERKKRATQPLGVSSSKQDRKEVRGRGQGGREGEGWARYDLIEILTETQRSSPKFPAKQRKARRISSDVPEGENRPSVHSNHVLVYPTSPRRPVVRSASSSGVFLGVLFHGAVRRRRPPALACFPPTNATTNNNYYA